jgi:hypothetical protein
MIVIFRKERLEAELAALRTAWKEQMERSLKAVSEEAARRLARNLEQMEKEGASRVAVMDKAFTEAENKLGSLREALNRQDERSRQALVQLQAAEQSINDRAAKLAEGTAEFENKLSGVREYLNEQNEHLQQSMRQQQFAEQRLSEQLAKLDVGLESAGGMLRNMENATAAAKETVRNTLENLARTSQSLIGNSERQLEESSRAATAKWVADIENKASDATYRTFELLFKASEWYGKKLQTQIETTLEKGLEQAAGNLREKAEAAFREFGVRADAAVGQLASLVETQNAQIRATSEAEGQKLADQFRAALTQAQSTLSKASQDLLAELRWTQEAVRLETGPRADELNETIAQLGEQAIKAYEKRLEDVSDSSLQNAVSRLSQKSEEHLETLLRSAEERLRQTCNEVFMEIGETLRQSLQEPKLPRPAAKSTRA